MTTVAEELRSLLPKKDVEQTVQQKPPRPLNEEALEACIEFAKQKASQGFGSVLLFLDGTFEQYKQISKHTTYYEESVVLNMLKSSELGLTVFEDYSEDGTSVIVQWSDDHPMFTYSYTKTIEVEPPDNYMAYLESISLPYC